MLQFLPRMWGQALPLHMFRYSSDAAIPTPTYKNLVIYICSSGNPSNYMKPARDNISRAYNSMRRRYCGLACGKNVWLQLQFLCRSSLPQPSLVVHFGACIPARLHSATKQQRYTLNICASCCESLLALTWRLSCPILVSCLYGSNDCKLQSDGGMDGDWTGLVELVTLHCLPGICIACDLMVHSTAWRRQSCLAH